MVQIETKREPPPIELVRPPVIRRGVLPGTKPQTEVEPDLFCSHQVGSTVKQGEVFHLTYKTANASVDVEFTPKAGGFVYKNESTHYHSASQTASRVEYCWDEDNCFVVMKNRDGSWTIKSLPFQ